MAEGPGHLFSVAPMMDWTDRHDRYFLRLITGRALLYTEMVTTGALLHGDRRRFLDFDPAERPLALQVGGAEPGELAATAELAEAWGYDEINLNVGCPSDRVQSGRFGACLMAEPDLVARCVGAMRRATALPVTVKCRIGIDRQDSERDLDRFVDEVAAGGCQTFIVHARKAWLSGLSPKENREIPPLDYERVYRLKARRPELEIIVNGGITTLEAAAAHLQHVDGVMLGRAAYQNPYILAQVDERFFGDSKAPPSRREVALAMIPYLERRRAAGVPVKSITRHMLGLFNGVPGARAWRRHLSEAARAADVGGEVIAEALAELEASRARIAA